MDKAKHLPIRGDFLDELLKEHWMFEAVWIFSVRVRIQVVNLKLVYA